MDQETRVLFAATQHHNLWMKCFAAWFFTFRFESGRLQSQLTSLGTFAFWLFLARPSRSVNQVSNSDLMQIWRTADSVQAFVQEQQPRWIRI